MFAIEEMVYINCVELKCKGKGCSPSLSKGVWVQVITGTQCGLIQYNTVAWQMCTNGNVKLMNKKKETIGKMVQHKKVKVPYFHSLIL